MLRFIGILLIVVLTGCGATLEQKWAAANETYIGSVNAVNDLYRAGQISDEKFIEIADHKQKASAALTAMDAAVKDGNEASFNTYLGIFWSWMDKVLEEQIAAEGGIT